MFLWRPKAGARFRQRNGVFSFSFSCPPAKMQGRAGASGSWRACGAGRGRRQNIAALFGIGNGRLVRFPLCGVCFWENKNDRAVFVCFNYFSCFWPFFFFFFFLCVMQTRGVWAWNQVPCRVVVVAVFWCRKIAVYAALCSCAAVVMFVATA